MIAKSPCSSSCSAVATPAGPPPTISTRFGAALAARLHRLDADRGRLQAGLARHRVGLAVREVVDAARARRGVQRAPVERGERGALAQRRVEPHLASVTAPRRETTRARSPTHARRASAGCSAMNGSGSAAISSGDLAVRVIVCHWLAIRPVVRTSGKAVVRRVGGIAGQRGRQDSAARTRVWKRPSV